MTVHPGPPTSGPPLIDVELGTAPSAADQIASTTGGGRHPDVIGSSRTCGRCRREFPIGSDVHPMELSDWWVCATCTDALLPTRHRSPA